MSAGLRAGGEPPKLTPPPNSQLFRALCTSAAGEGSLEVVLHPVTCWKLATGRQARPLTGGAGRAAGKQTQLSEPLAPAAVHFKSKTQAAQGGSMETKCMAPKERNGALDTLWGMGGGKPHPKSVCVVKG